MLSAIKVSRVLGNVGVAIMGSSVSMEQARRIAAVADNVVIFLDNDNDQVRANQKKAKTLLEPLIRGEVRIIKADKDPKEHSDAELRELLG